MNKVPTVDEREWRHSRYRKRMENIRQELEGLEVCCAHSTDDYLKIRPPFEVWKRTHDPLQWNRACPTGSFLSAVPFMKSQFGFRNNHLIHFRDGHYHYKGEEIK